MLKSELLKRICQQQSELERADVELSAKLILERMTAAMAEGRRIEIRGFGTFSKRIRAPRTLRNPRTGGSLRVSRSVLIRFKSGVELRNRVKNWKKVTVLPDGFFNPTDITDPVEGESAAPGLPEEKAEAH